MSLYLIDAGHAPSTPGKRSPLYPNAVQLLEWEYTRELADKLTTILTARGIECHELVPRMREDMGPTARAGLANYIAGRVEQDCILVSLHGNASRGKGWTSPDGVTTFYWCTSQASKDIAAVFQRHIAQETGWRDRGVKPTEKYSILKRTTMPAVLTESGFYTNLKQCTEMSDPQVRTRVAAAHARAICELEGVGWE